MPRPLATILGAGPGIGLAVARRFAREGFRIAMISRPSDDLDPFKQALGSDALVFGADLLDTRRRDEILAQIRADAGPTQVLIYNASLGHGTPPSRLDQSSLMQSMQMNAWIPLACAQWAIRDMLPQRRGTILFTGGGLALHPKFQEADLSMGKAALRSLALCLADELKSEEIHVATVTVSGFVQASTSFNADHVANAFWELHAEPKEHWQSEVILRP